MRYGLKDSDIDKINSVFINYKEINSVILYGSRAKGNYKNGSDIDLTIKGSLSLLKLHEIELDIDDLFLPYNFDLSVYEKIQSEDLKSHIRRVGKEFYKKTT